MLAKAVPSLGLHACLVAVETRRCLLVVPVLVVTLHEIRDCGGLAVLAYSGYSEHVVTLRYVVSGGAFVVTDEGCYRYAVTGIFRRSLAFCNNASCQLFREAKLYHRILFLLCCLCPYFASFRHTFCRLHSNGRNNYYQK